MTHSAPHLLILDEPTNHLDVDTREALVQALAEYRGAVVVVSHDRHMLELVADRLVLVDQGTAQEYDGTIDDYAKFIVSGGGGEAKPASAGGGGARKEDRKAAADRREATQGIRTRIKDAETEMARLAKSIADIDSALAGTPPTPAMKLMTMGQLMKRRGDVERLAGRRSRPSGSRRPRRWKRRRRSEEHPHPEGEGDRRRSRWWRGRPPV